ncbi:MAG: IPT/TIG domain-containing protein [Pyrinomonadaceae bacterium]
MTDINNPAERKKLIWALALGVIALLLLWWAFFGFGGGATSNTPRTAATPSPGSRTQRAAVQPQTPDDLKGTQLDQLIPVRLPDTPPSVPEAKRNIFAYYEKSEPAPKPSVEPLPSPTPSPPLLLATLSPSNVYARTSDFTLEVTGDKFTPDVRVTVDGRELPTRFVSPQQLSASVPASIIANAGARQVTIRSANGQLYSNVSTLNVSAPPTPNFGYIGIIGTYPRMDTAILQDKSNKEVHNVQRGDVVGARFRVTSISDKEVVLVDTNLKIRHAIERSSDGEKGTGPLSRPTPRVESEDDEP